MDTKIISLPKKKNYSLSRLMIVALVEACIKQNRGIPFGPVDIKGGSFAPLMKRGLIVHDKVTFKNQTKSLWQVTPKAFEILKDLGVNVDDYFDDVTIEKNNIKSMLKE